MAILLQLLVILYFTTFSASAVDQKATPDSLLTSTKLTVTAGPNDFPLLKRRFRQSEDNPVSSSSATPGAKVAAQRMMEAIRKGRPILIAEPEKAYFVGTGRSRSVKIGCQAVNAIQINFICNDKHVGPNEIKTIEVEDEKTGLRVMESYIIRDREMIEERLQATTTYSPSSSTSSPILGPYWCQCLVWSLNANPQTGQPDSLYSRRSVIHLAYLKKKFEREPLSQRVTVGGSATFTCSPPDALPEPAILWFRDNRPIDNDGRRIVVDQKLRQLSIFEVRPEDNANYTCVVENVAGKRISPPALLVVVQDGGWSTWSSWSRCVADNDQVISVDKHGTDDCQLSGYQRRLRTCTNPEPKNGGKPCIGDEFETSPCSIPCHMVSPAKTQQQSADSPKPTATTNQGWSAWSTWSECSPAPECRRTRRRTCLITETSSVGCSGLNSQSISCSPSQCGGPRIPADLDSTTRPLISSPNTLAQDQQWHPAETALLVTIPLCGILIVVLLALVGVWIKRRCQRRHQLNVVLASTDFVSGSRGMKFFSGTGSQSIGSADSKNNHHTIGFYPAGSSSSGVSSDAVPLRMQNGSGSSAGSTVEGGGGGGRRLTTEVFIDNSNYTKARAIAIGSYQGSAAIAYTSPPLSTSPPGGAKVPCSEPLTRRSPPRAQPGLVVVHQDHPHYGKHPMNTKKHYQHEHSLAAMPLIGSNCGASSSSADVDSPPSTSTSPGTASLNHRSPNNSGIESGLVANTVPHGFVTPPPYTPPMLLPGQQRYSVDLSQQSYRLPPPQGASDRLSWNQITSHSDSELVLPLPINARLFVPAGFCYSQPGEAYLTVIASNDASNNDSNEDIFPRINAEANETLLSPVIEWGIVSDQQTIIDGQKPAVLSFPHSAVGATLPNWEVELLFSPTLSGSSWQKFAKDDQTAGNNTQMEMRFHLSGNRVFIFTRQTGRFAIVGRPRHSMSQSQNVLPASKRLSFAVFLPRHLISGSPSEMPTEVNLLLYALNDNGIDLSEAVRVEDELGLCLVAPETIYSEPNDDQNSAVDEGLPVLNFVHADSQNNNDLSIEIGEVSAPWFLRGHAKQNIPHGHVWGATPRSLMHCSFTFSRNSPAAAHHRAQMSPNSQTALACTLVIRQTSSTIVLKIDCGSLPPLPSQVAIVDEETGAMLCRPTFGNAKQ